MCSTLARLLTVAVLELEAQGVPLGLLPVGEVHTARRHAVPWTQGDDCSTAILYPGRGAPLKN